MMILSPIFKKIHCFWDDRSQLERILIVCLIAGLFVLCILALVIVLSAQNTTDTSHTQLLADFYTANFHSTTRNRTMNTVSTHILDISKGQPASNLKVVLQRKTTGLNYTELAMKRTGSDGRVSGLISDSHYTTGTYRMKFFVGDYYARVKCATSYPQIEVHFLVDSTAVPAHIPLLISPYGYSTFHLQFR